MKAIVIRIKSHGECVCEREREAQSFPAAKEMQLPSRMHALSLRHFHSEHWKFIF